MVTLEAVLTDPQSAALYGVTGRLSLQRVRAAAGQADRALYVLEGTAIADKASFLRACAVTLAFPAYFGQNWDALQDCLTDLAWAPPQGRVILYRHAAPFMRQAPADWRVALDILSFAVTYWRATPTPLWVFFHGIGRASALRHLDP